MNDMSYDPQNYQRKMELEWIKIVKSTLISENNKKHIEDFKNFLLDKELHPGRILQYLVFIKSTAEKLGKDLKEASEIDMRRVWRELKNRWKDSTKLEFIIINTCFFKWLFKTEVPPETVKWMKEVVKCLEISYKLPEEMLDEKEILQMIDAETSVRNKTIIYTLFISGARASEFLRLRVKDVELDNLGAILCLQQTKGGHQIRKVRCIECASYLRIWLKEHPFRNNPEVPLWVNDNLNRSGTKEMLSYDNLKMLVKRTAKKAGINKRVHPHLFRHSRATDLTKKGFNEAQLRMYFGWTRNSNMPGFYIHLASKDLDIALSKAAGLPVNEEEYSPKPKKCPRCEEINSQSTNFCIRCGWDLRANIVDLIKKNIDEQLETNKETNIASLKKKCPRCPHENPITSKFCNECGMPLRIIPHENFTETVTNRDDIQRL